MREAVYTIGHSTYPVERLIDLLQLHNITALCDVRSQPYSRVNPQYNREDLKIALQARGIEYVFLGKELGARSEDPSCYLYGKVQYDRLAETDLFRYGLGRVQDGMKEYRIVLMCAEKEPLECHRTILVGRYLVELGIEVQHIHSDGRIESHGDALIRLARMLKLREAEEHMFRTREALFADAYSLQEKRIGYDSDSTEARSNVG